MPPYVKMKMSNHSFSAPYTHTGVQSLIRFLMDSQGIGQFEVSKRSGLSPATLYQILNKTEKQVTRPPRRSTVSALGRVIGADVQFDSDKNLFHLTQRIDMPKTEEKELSLMLSEIGSWVLSRGRPVTREDRALVVRVVKALIP